MERRLYDKRMKSNSKTSTEAENFRRFVRGIMSVPGAEVKAEIERQKQVRKKKRAKTSPASRASNDKD
jgi:hypothetical protein